MRRKSHSWHCNEDAPASQPLGALVKALKVLDAFEELVSIGMPELARRLKMDNSVVSQTLTAFRSRRFLVAEQVVQQQRLDH